MKDNALFLSILPTDSAEEAFLYEETQRIRIKKEACSCVKNIKNKPLKRAITIAKRDKSIGQILDNIGSMLIAKNIKLPPNNLQNGTKLNLLKLQEMTGIDRNNIYNWINNGGSTSKLVQEVGFCACCQTQLCIDIVLTTNHHA